MAYKGIRRRAIRRKPGSKKPEYISPQKKVKGLPYSQTKEYKYFEGHIVPEIAKKLPQKNVSCWYNGHLLSLPVCAIRKFWQQKTYCKRCPLFQKDEHAQQLRSLIQEWETDDLEENLDGRD